MTGHIKLGEPGDLRDYALLDPRQYHAQPVNPMAAKIGTGAGSYDDFMGWAFWVQEDWGGGAGRRAGDGVLFGDAATFQSGRMTLPLKTWPVTMEPPAYGKIAFPWGLDGELSVGAGQTLTKIVQWFDVQPADQFQQFWVLVNPEGAATLTITLERGATMEAPTEIVASVTLNTATARPGPQWWLLDLGTAQTLSASYKWFLGVSSTGVVRVPYWKYNAGISPLAARGAPGYAYVTRDGSNVTIGAIANNIPYSLSAGGWSSAEPVDMVQWDDRLMVYGRAYLYRLTPGSALQNDKFDLVSFEAPAGCSDLQVWNDRLYSAHGANGLWQMETDGTLSEVLNGGLSQPATLLHAWNGFLFVAYQNKLWYSDGNSWKGAFEFGPSNGYQIRGMAGLGDSLYISTDDGLWRLAPGDLVEGIAPWPSISALNGRRMVVHNGALYMPMGNRVLMFAENGALQDVWVDSRTKIPPEYMGQIHSLCSSQMGLIATVSPVDDSLSASVWLMTTEGWHVLAILPPGMGAGRVTVDSAHDRIWIATKCGIAWSLWWQPMAAAPVANANQPWQYAAWVEWDWYTGDLVDVDKDWESVTVFGENLSENRSVSVYYQELDGGAWRWLGTATNDNVEMRFDQWAYRPQGPKLKLGLLLRTNDYRYTPSVRSIRVKYHPMLTDRWRWQLALPVHDGQEMPDGSINGYSAVQVRSHLDALIERIPPAVLEDLDGVQYEIKIIGATRQVAEWQWRPEMQAPVIDWLYTLTIEQVTSQRYLPVILGVRTVYGIYELGANEMLEIGEPGMLIIEDA